MKKVLLVLTSADDLNGHPTGYTLSEAAHPWKVFRDAGHIVDFASIQGGTPPVDPTSETDEITEEFQNDYTVKKSLENTAKVDDVDASQYDAIYLVGGHGTMVDFRGNKGLAKLIQTVDRSGGIVSAVCHGPSGLLDVKAEDGTEFVRGRTISAFTQSEEEAIKLADKVDYPLSETLAEQGAELKAADDFEEQVVVDDLLVTGQNPASAAGVAKEVVKILTTLVREEKAAEEEAAEQLRAEKDAEKEPDAE